MGYCAIRPAPPKLASEWVLPLLPAVTGCYPGTGNSYLFDLYLLFIGVTALPRFPRLLLYLFLSVPSVLSQTLKD